MSSGLLERVVKERKQQRSVSVDSGNASGGDLMAALKERMNLRRKGISGSRKGPEEEGAAGMDAGSSLPPMPTIGERSQTMPVLPSSSRDDDDDGPISMGGGMKAALQRTASNRPPSDDGDDWSDSD